MKKKVLAFMCCMIMIMAVFTGCSLFEENQERQLNQVVASVGSVNVTLEELLRSYSNNAQTLTQNYGYSAEEAVDYCIDSLLARGVVFEFAKEMKKDGKILVTDADRSQIMVDLVDYFNSLMDAYEEESLRDLNLESPNPSEEDEAEESAYTAETKFERTYEYEIKVTEGEGGVKSYALQVKDLNDEEMVEVIIEYVNIFKAYENNEDITNSLFKILDDSYVSSFGQELKDKIYENITIAYKNSYKFYKGLSTKDVIVKEMTKILKDKEKQLYIDKVSEYYTKLAQSNLNPQSVVDNYLAKYNASKSKYENNIDAYVKAMLESASGVYYHPNQTEFAYVSHVLMQYSDEQEADLKTKKEILSNEEYELYAKKQADAIKVKKYDTNGNVVAEDLSPAQVLEEIQNAVKAGKNAQERTRIFNEYVYSINMDPGIKNAEQDYAIGRQIKESGDETRSKMVSEFTLASRALLESYLYVQNGGILPNIENDMKTKEEVEGLKDGEYVGLIKEHKVVLDNSILVGSVGSMTGLVQTEYGYHIIMFTGVPTNLDLVNGKINSTRVKPSDVNKFGLGEWEDYAQNNTISDLASLKAYNMIKLADSTANITVEDIKNGKVLTNAELQVIMLDCVTVNPHSDKTYVDDALSTAISNLASASTNAIYSNYVSSFKGTDKTLMKNKAIYEYLYKA